MNRFLITTIASELAGGSPNGSSAEVENIINSKDIVSYIKKTKDGIPYASAQWTKHNVINMFKQYGLKVSDIQNLGGEDKNQQIISEGDPFSNIDEDLNGFMNAVNIKIPESEYEQLEDYMKKVYVKEKDKKIEIVNKVYKTSESSKKKLTLDEYEELADSKKEKYSLFEDKKKEQSYILRKTKKRRAVVQASIFKGSKKSIKKEFCVNSRANGTNALYQKEICSDIFSQSFNVDLNRLGKFKVGTEPNGFIDYFEWELIKYGLTANEDGYVELPKEKKVKRLKYFLTSLEKYNTTVRQTNNLEDLRPKFVILTELTIGNNPFLFVYKNGKLNIEMLKEELEALYDDDELASDVYIGVASGFLKDEELDNLNEMINDLEDGLKEKIHLTNVHKAFKSYKETL